MYSNEIVCSILDYINDNIKTKIKIEDISNHLCYDRYYLMKLFKNNLNISIIDYINIKKINNSLEFLRNNNNLLNVALNSGFYSLEYFSEMFKKILGINPSTYRKIIKRNINIKENDINIFQKNYLNLISKLEFIDTYLQNRKPKVIPVRKLSIFR